MISCPCELLGCTQEELGKTLVGLSQATPELMLVVGLFINIGTEFGIIPPFEVCSFDMSPKLILSYVIHKVFLIAHCDCVVYKPGG